MKKIFLFFCLLFFVTVSYAQVDVEKRYKKIETTRIAIQIDFPYVSQAEEFNQAVNALIDKEYKEFESVEHDAYESAKGLSTFKMRYETYKPDNVILSIRFSIDTFVAGGVYPNLFHDVINYDSKINKLLTLADIFKPNVNYQDLLTDYCSKQLVSKTGYPLNQLKEGSFVIFKNWNLTDKGLLFTFDEFPHAIGFQEVLVPYKFIEDKLNERYLSLAQHKSG